MGSSTLIAAHVGIKRLVAVDSAKEWVENVRDLLKDSPFEFRHGDIGPLGPKWGIPADKSHIDRWPAFSEEVLQEKEPFDVYQVDGRFRIACACRALLHGTSDSLVLMHDFVRYRDEMLKIADQAEVEGRLSVLRRKPGVSDAEIEAMWEVHKTKWL